MDLCEEENDFRQKRKHVVFKAMQKLLGERGPRTLDEVEKETLATAHKAHTHARTKKKLIIHIDLVKSNWVIQCIDERSYSLHTELQIFNMY